jgi:hypothetical protein
VSGGNDCGYRILVLHLLAMEEKGVRFPLPAHESDSFLRQTSGKSDLPFIYIYIKKQS